MIEGACRRIEDCFRVLDTGFGAQRTAFRTAVRPQRDVAIKSVIAWRLMVLTLLGREVPEQEAELPSTDPESELSARPCRRLPS